MIDIELIEGKFYFVRAYKLTAFSRKITSEIEQFHGRLIEINLDRRNLVFEADEYYGNRWNCPFDSIFTIIEIESKGKRLLELIKEKEEEE